MPCLTAVPYRTVDKDATASLCTQPLIPTAVCIFGSKVSPSFTIHQPHIHVLTSEFSKPPLVLLPFFLNPFHPQQLLIHPLCVGFRLATSDTVHHWWLKSISSSSAFTVCATLLAISNFAFHTPRNFDFTIDNQGQRQHSTASTPSLCQQCRVLPQNVDWRANLQPSRRRSGARLISATAKTSSGGP